MRKLIAITLLLMPLCVTALPQTPRPGDDQPVRISTELVQIDVVVTDKQLLRRAIAALGPVSHARSVFEAADGSSPGNTPSPAGGSDTGADISGDESDTNSILRAYMSLGTASYVIDGLKQLPGRKSMILISSGLPIFSSNRGNSAANITNFLNSLTDKAARAGVAINAFDIRGMKAHSGMADFQDTAGVSAMGAGGGPRAFGRLPDDAQFGYKNPFDVIA